MIEVMEVELRRINVELTLLRQRIAARRRLERELELEQQRLAAERARLEVINAELEQIVRQLKALTGFSLQRLMWQVIGALETRLQACRQAQRSALLRQGKSRTAITALTQTGADINRQLAELAGCENQFQAILKSKEALIMGGERPIAPEIQAVHEAVRYTQIKLEHLAQARQAGKESLAHLQQVVDSGRSFAGRSFAGRSFAGRKFAGKDRAWLLFEEGLPILKMFTTRLDRLALTSQDIRQKVDEFVRATHPLLENPEATRASLAGHPERIISLYQQIEVVLGMLKVSEADEQKQLTQLNETRQRLIESAV